MGLLLKKRKRGDSDSGLSDEGQDGERLEGAGGEGVAHLPSRTRRKPRTIPGKLDEHNTALEEFFKTQDNSQESKGSSERLQSPKECVQGPHLPSESEAAPGMKRSTSATYDEQDNKGGDLKKQALQGERSPKYSELTPSAEKPSREAGKEDQMQSSGTLAKKSGGPEAVPSKEESATSAASQEQLCTLGASGNTLLHGNTEQEGPGSSAKESNKEAGEEDHSSVLEEEACIRDEENQQLDDTKATLKDPFREFMDIVENLAELTNSTEEESGADDFVSSDRWDHQEKTQRGSQMGQTPQGASPLNVILRNDDSREEQNLDRRTTSETVITIKEEPEDEIFNDKGFKSMHKQSNSLPRLEIRSSTDSIDIKCVKRHVLEEKCNRLAEEKSKLEIENRNLRERLKRESQASKQRTEDLNKRLKRSDDQGQTAIRQFKLLREAIYNFKMALKTSVLCLRKANIALTNVVDDDREILHSLSNVQLGGQSQEEILSNLSSATAPKFRELVVLMLGTTFQRLTPLEALQVDGAKELRLLALTIKRLFFTYTNAEAFSRHRTQAQQQSVQQPQARNHQAQTRQSSLQMRASNEFQLLQRQHSLQQQQRLPSHAQQPQDQRFRRAQPPPQHLQQQQQQQQRLPSHAQQPQDQRFRKAQPAPQHLQQEQQGQQYQQQRQSFRNASQSQQLPHRQHPMPYQQLQQPMQHYQQPMQQYQQPMQHYQQPMPQQHQLRQPMQRTQHHQQTLPRHQF